MSKLPPVYSPAEERTNVWTHAAGAVIALAGVVGAFFIAPPSGVAGTAGYLVYGVSLVLMYLASACYHGVSEPSRRALLRRFDHAAIYLLIAGTYTPFLLVGLNSPLAKGLMIVIWSLALLGILFKLTIAHRFKILSLVTYLTMGWLSLIVVYQLAVKLAVGGVTLLAVGGVVYSLGVIFYVCKRIPYNHAIWHGFVLGGSVCHFLAIYLYIGQS